MYLFEKVLPGWYKFSFDKEKYRSSSISFNIVDSVRVHSAQTAVLSLIPFNYRPFILLATVAGFISVVYIYWSSNKATLPKITHLFKSEPILKEEILDEKIVERIKPVYFDSDKGAIIKTICIDGFHNLSDIHKHSELEDNRFWDAFYELLTEGELETNNKGQYQVREDIKKQWLDYL